MSDKPCTWDDIKVGAKVKCIYKREPNYYGKTAIIDSVIANSSGSPRCFYVKWEDKELQDACWGNAESFSFIVAAATTSSHNVVKGGMQCADKYCREYNEYAQPNMPDGRYFCYSCRTAGRAT